MRCQQAGVECEGGDARTLRGKAGFRKLTFRISYACPRAGRFATVVRGESAAYFRNEWENSILSGLVLIRFTLRNVGGDAMSTYVQYRIIYQ